MSIFKTNPNETAYHEGKKHIIDVIKNTGDGEYLIWKQPEEDFNTHSQLIVMPGETAIFVDGGNIVQQFTSGTYDLNTKNYPFISRLINTLSGGISVFNCVVYFFRKADSKELRWGLSSPVVARDKVYGIRTEVRVRGVYKIRIENPTLFLDKLVGSNTNFQEQSELDDFFSDQIQTNCRSAISSFLNNYDDELIGLDAHLAEISNTIQPVINAMMQEYGIRCVNFSVSAMDIDKSKYDSIDEAQVSGLKKIREGEAQQRYMETLGQNWDKMQNANILEKMAQNEGAGGIGTMGAGLGMGVAAAETFGSMTDKMFNGVGGNNNEVQTATTVAQSGNDARDTLKKLKELLDEGLIEQSEYDDKKREILARM